MLKKIQFPLSVIALIVMILVWKAVFETYLPNTPTATSTRVPQTTTMSVLKVLGQVLISSEGRKTSLKEGEEINNSATLYTSANSTVILGYGPNHASKIKIGPVTTVEFKKIKTDQIQMTDNLFFFIQRGIVVFKIFNPNKNRVLQVKTPTMAMGIRGTTFAVESTRAKSTLLVHEGSVEVLSNKGKPEIANAGQGFEAQQENDLKEVSVREYNINWDFDNDTEFNSNTSSNLSLPALLEREIKRLQNNFQELKNNRPNQLQEIADKEKALDVEADLIKNDHLCLQSLMKECEFKSEHFKNDVANLKNNPIKLTNNPAIKINLETEMEKAQKDISQTKSELKSATDTIEAKFITEQSRLNEVISKYDQYKAANQNDQKNLLKDIDKLIDSPELHAELEKMNN